MNNYEVEYRNILNKILRTKNEVSSRTGKCYVVFNTSLKVDLREGFPMLTGRKMYWKTVKAEAEWMLSGSTNVKDLHKSGVHIWDQWANADGELGPTYGAQLAKQWPLIVESLTNDPLSRRHIISLWDIDRIDDMALPPCYYAIQFYVFNGRLNMTVTSRSSDVAVGLPYDIAVLAYLQHLMAAETGWKPALLTFNSCNTHLNVENEDGVLEYLNNLTGCLPDLVERQLVNYGSYGDVKMIVKP